MMAKKEWTIVQKCEQGNKPKPCCEDYCSSLTTPKVKVMALCDGVSSSRLAHIGARVAADFSVEFFSKHFDDIYDREYNETSRVLIQYHQAFLEELSKVAEAQNGTAILRGKRIITDELGNYCTTIQLVAICENKCIYFKVGNGCAIILKKKHSEVLSDSIDDDSTDHLTFANTLSVLKQCEIKSFVIPEDVTAIILSTDGAEFENGIYYNHCLQSVCSELLSLIVDEKLTDAGLENIVCEMKQSPFNWAKDDIGVSIIYAHDLSSDLKEGDELDSKVVSKIKRDSESETAIIIDALEVREQYIIDSSSYNSINDIISKVIGILDQCLAAIDKALSKIK